MGILIVLLIVAFPFGFAIAGKSTKNIPVQIIVGMIIGVLLVAGLAAVLFGVAFAGCLFLASRNH